MLAMHARKPQRMNDGYFEKHQSHSYQSSKYNNSKRDYDRDRSSFRDRDLSPGDSLNNGSGSYRSQSPEIDSPSSRGVIDHHRGGGSSAGPGGGGDRFSYIQKMRDRDRDLYKKDKYLDKRDRRAGDRDSESHRTNHDRIDRRGGGGGGSSSSSKLCSSSADKRSGSDDRDRDRDRHRTNHDRIDRRAGASGSSKIATSSLDKRAGSDERDRDRDRAKRARDRGGGGNERVARCGDWTEHVSSSGKMYYYNCKTEVSQWEKPKEWIERERNLSRDQHREKDYRDKERDRNRDERFARTAYTKHSSSRENSRMRWNYDNEGAPPSSRRRLEGRIIDNTDMDISPGDSTPTSEASYPLTGTPTAHHSSGNAGSSGTILQHNDQNVIPSTTVGLPNALPRLASHPHANSLSSITPSTLGNSSSSSSSLHYPGASGSAVGTCIVVGGSNSNASSSSHALPSSSGSLSHSSTTNSNQRKLDALQQHQQSQLNTNASPSNTATFNPVDHHLNSNAPGPPKLSSKDQHLRHSSSHHSHHLTTQHSVESQLIGSMPPGIESSNHVLSSPAIANLRDNAMGSPHYNSTHGLHGTSSPMGYSKNSQTNSGVTGGNNSNAAMGNLPGGSGSNTALVSSGSSGSSYTCNTAYGHKTVEACSGSLGGAINSSSGGNSSSTHCSSSSLALPASGSGGNSSSAVGNVPGEGPPTPTQELDLSGTSTSSGLDQQQQQQQQRRLDSTSSAATTLSNLQSCVAASSVQTGQSRGPEISPKLAKYFRADLITHVTNWPAEILEKQAQKCSEESHFYGDLQVTKVSTDLKCARSLARVTEITATLQEQKIMYLRQQIQRLQESKSQNSFMSDDL